MDRRKVRPHVLIFPLPFQGPMNSMFKLAELLCIAGLHVTVLLTQHIHARLLLSADAQSHFARYPGFRLKSIPDGLPEDHPRSGDRFMEMFDSLKSKTKPLFKEILTSAGCLSSESLQRPVSFIIADGILGFACDVATELGIPIVSFRTISPCCLWLFFCLPKLIEARELPFAGDDLDAPIKSVPGMECFLRWCDLPCFCRSGDLSNEKLQLFKTESLQNAKACGLILNTFEELDGSLLSHIKTVCPNLYTIGPLHAHLETKLYYKEMKTSPTSSCSLWEEDTSCMTWLDSQPSNSVIYVSFGSIATLTREQLMEFWHGLVNSGCKFLWVMRPDSVAGDDWESQIPTELSDGTTQRGCIVGWAPQEKVLEHPAIGGFLTHSGWNSTLESISAGVPMICWPYFADQLVNSRVVSEVWKLGLDMKDTCDRGVVERLVRELMQVRKEEFLHRADEMAKLAKRSLSEGGSSRSNLDRLIRDIHSMSS